MEIIYGKNSVETYVLHAPKEVRQLFLQEGLQKNTQTFWQNLASQHGLSITLLSKKEIAKRVGDVVHQGILAEINDFAYAQLPQVMEAVKNKGKVPFFLLLDQLQDPRNLGAILRSADCAGGVDGVIITKHHSAEVTATVIKTSTGAALNIPIIQVTNARTAVQELKRHGIWLGGLDMDGAIHYRKQQYDLPLCLVVGGEDSGVRPIMKKEMDFNVYIPMHSQTVNSLNVAVATSLLLYEVAHQRQELL